MDINDIDREFRIYRLRERMQKTAGMWENFKNALTNQAIGGMATATLAAGATAAGYGLGKLKDTIVKGRAMKSMLEANPHLAKQDSKQVHMTFNSLYHMNPDLATDPLVAGSFVTRSINRVEGGDSSGAYIDPSTATQLTKGKEHEDPIMHAFLSAKPFEEKKVDNRPSLHEQAQLKQYEAQLRENPQLEFGTAPPKPAPPESPRQKAEKAFKKK